MDAILTCFSQLEDPRSPINRVHLLGDLLVICIMAVIAGADGPQAIGIWAQANQEWLNKRLKLPGGIPSHDTLGRLLTALKPDVFQDCFQSWLQSLAPLDEDDPSNQIAIDGKVLKRSHDKRNGLGPLWLVSAWAVGRSLSLGQLATFEKSNEITAIPELLDNIELKDSVVTIDAAGCQTAIAKKIIDARADFVLALKGNQKTLHDAVTEYFFKQMETTLQT
ncbi:MAG: ISAs1 family transposase [Fuerstiella sp.]